jgi:hypothetical protein
MNLIGSHSLWGTFVAGIAFLAAVESATAETVAYNVGNCFATCTAAPYTVIHDATTLTDTINGVQYYGTGTTLFGNPTFGQLFGELTQTATEKRLTNLHGIVQVGSDAWLTISDGMIVHDSSLTGSNRASGTMAYMLVAPGVNTSGTFYFHPNTYASLFGSNTINIINEFTLLGNNWNNGVDPLPTSDRLGLNIRADLTQVPLPMSALLFGTGLVGLGISEIRRISRRLSHFQRT